MKDQATEPIEVDQHITAHGRYFAGKAGSRFYRELRDEKKILASPCPKCGVVYWPPRSTCPRCFSGLHASDMIEVGPGGSLETFTCVNYETPAHPKKAPLIYGVIKLDGADTAISHLIGEADPERLEIGMRLVPVFREERSGCILDIEYFKPKD